MITEQWQELKETIMELRDGEGTLTQQEVGEFLVNYMNVLERQDEYEEAVQNILDDIWDSAIEETRKPRKPKEDKVKELLYMTYHNGLEINVNIENFDVKPNKVSFDYDGCNYSLVITRHRNK